MTSFIVFTGLYGPFVCRKGYLVKFCLVFCKIFVHFCLKFCDKVSFFVLAYFFTVCFHSVKRGSCKIWFLVYLYT